MIIKVLLFIGGLAGILLLQHIEDFVFNNSEVFLWKMVTKEC